MSDRLRTARAPVTDEMVDRGLRATYGDRYIDSLDPLQLVEKAFEMRQILAAALGEDCPRCAGHGSVPQPGWSRRIGFTCPECDGTGERAPDERGDSETADQPTYDDDTGPFDHGPFDPDELVRWAESYGHPEYWAKRAQQLHREKDELWERSHKMEVELRRIVDQADALVEALEDTGMTIHRDLDAGLRRLLARHNVRRRATIYWRCVCGPDTELIQTPNGDRWLISHHSLDGREYPVTNGPKEATMNVKDLTDAERDIYTAAFKAGHAEARGEVTGHECPNCDKPVHHSDGICRDCGDQFVHTPEDGVLCGTCGKEGMDDDLPLA